MVDLKILEFAMNIRIHGALRAQLIEQQNENIEI